MGRRVQRGFGKGGSCLGNETLPRLCWGFFVGTPRGVNYRRGKWNFRMAAQNPFPVSRSFCSLSIPLGIPIPCPSLGHFQRCLRSRSLFGHADSNFPSPAAFPVIPLPHPSRRSSQGTPYPCPNPRNCKFSLLLMKTTPWSLQLEMAGTAQELQGVIPD